MTANRIATVMLRGHCVTTGVFPLRSLRSVNQCDAAASTIDTIDSTNRAVPIRIAPSCRRVDCSFGTFSRSERKKPIIPKPKLPIVKLVRSQASVVRSSAKLVRKLAMLVRFAARLTGSSRNLVGGVFICCDFDF